jgi:RNA polymerase sigma factor (sigma-70 family)
VKSLPLSRNEQRNWFPKWPPEVRADFFDNYHRVICAVARRFKLETEGADIAQDTVLRMRTIHEDYDPARPLWPWVQRVVYYVILERKRRRRKESRNVPFPLECEPEVDEHGFAQVWQRELLDLIKRRIAGKQGLEATVAQARLIDDMAIEDVTRQFNVSAAYVYNAARRLREQLSDLRNHYEEE